jgi:hypothetical protein
VLGVVAEDELEDEGLDGVVALPPPEAEPETEPEPDGLLGVVAVEELEPAEPVARSGPRSHAARPRAIATAIANVVSLMSPPWVGIQVNR